MGPGAPSARSSSRSIGSARPRSWSRSTPTCSAAARRASRWRATSPEAAPQIQREAFRGLTDDMRAGRVALLLVLGGNPVFTAPADLRFNEALDRVPFRAHLGLYDDETARLCHWHVPEAHYLESWGDVRAVDGTATLLQPLIAPLYG